MPSQTTWSKSGSRVDDAEFERVVDNLVVNIAAARTPNRFIRVCVKGWFGHRWLSFSGKGRVSLDSGGLRGIADTALAPIRQDALTPPPFSPGRLLSERHWSRGANGNYSRVEPEPWLWSRSGHSAKNLQRRVADLFSEACIAWSSEALGGRASLLLYEARDGQATGWFAGFRLQEGVWRVDQVSNVERAAVEAGMVVPLRPTVTFG